MTSPFRGLRAALAADPAVGAGNVLTTRVERDLHPDAPALTFDTPVDGLPAWQPLSVRRLDHAVRIRASALHELGIRRRDPVAVQASNASDNILGFLALTRLGAIPALVNPLLDGPLTARYLAERLGPGVRLLADAEHLNALTGHRHTPLADIRSLVAGDPDTAPTPYRHWGGDPIAITHSSGTTGLPKAVVHSHDSLYAAIRHRLRLPRPQGSHRMLSALPSPHAATLIAVNLALSFGSELLPLSRQTGPDVLDSIERWRPASVYGFATTWTDLARHDLSARDLDSVALWWNTGDCAHETHIRRLVNAGTREQATRDGRVRIPGSVFVDGLGSTEMGHSHFFISHSADSSRYGRCVGRPHAFVDCAVLGPDGDELPPGEVGELGTRSPTLALGYWNDSETTYRTRVRGYFLTGDLMYRDEEGYYYHVDRAVDSVDLPGGQRLHTALCEEHVLAACPEVLDCTVVAVRSGDRTTTDVLLQLAPGAAPSDDRAPAIRDALGPDVAATLRDILVVADEELPLGPTGKVRKMLLRERHLARTAAA
ncbi:AMP-dependent synthetase [Streptomyces pluripotens]|uniref:AMP-dependent synthetase n=1 Tax=Streptomyces pluripotens TaxID=1355015 RepID=A0A221P719_9ACTN|nr:MULTISPECIES: class I adenylate-forming enzyme family protein [Streptomyces]ARP73759.1 AMP-dependent synthetase [Streptomyces pluripotens]ASN28007.1 AMP-dependent synthetase [Streptomyces pluripotens]KIE27919.1 AMP-dependent synthetase [Streptomyces sp. MUSC 125]